jgi:hypothetical protein
MIGGTERLLEARSAVPADRQKSIGEAEPLLLTNASQPLAKGNRDRVVMLSPVNFASSSASRWASRFLIFGPIFYLSLLRFRRSLGRIAGRIVRLGGATSALQLPRTIIPLSPPRRLRARGREVRPVVDFTFRAAACVMKISLLFARSKFAASTPKSARKTFRKSNRPDAP